MKDKATVVRFCWNTVEHKAQCHRVRASLRKCAEGDSRMRASPLTSWFDFREGVYPNNWEARYGRGLDDTCVVTDRIGYGVCLASSSSLDRC